MYSSPQQTENLKQIQIRAEMQVLYAAGYCHDGNDNWIAPESDQALPREQAYQKLMEWD